MKIAFFGTKPYDKVWFQPLAEEYKLEIEFVESKCDERSLVMAKGADAICVFVNDKITAPMINTLCDMGVRGILLRSAGFNNVDMKAAKDKITVLRVPSYSPEAVAEYALAMLLTINRKTHRAYTRTRDFNMSIQGLMGTNIFGKTIGVVGTGKIGQAMIQLLKGFQGEIIAYDPFPNPNLDVTYVSLEELMKKSDIITLHCPLTADTKYLINKYTISLMKDNVYLINTSRGALIESNALIDGLLKNKFAGVGLDVYEEEAGVFFEDRSDDIIQDENLARLTTFPNVLITSHMGFFTSEAMEAIARTTLENALELEKGGPYTNEVK
ncbi:MAG: 2-hydroxyacid dehydrogenase [Lachnospiraceae bacterium]|nr:2-hydroxyacid dehydrogenase [Lachnospiraceae bacterium]